MRPARPAALLLDLDGTLVNSEPIHRATFRSWFAARGWPVDDELLRLFTGRRADDVFAAEQGPWSGEDPAVLVQEVLEHLPADLAPEVVPGAGELLAWAAQHAIPLALVTSANRVWAARVLDAGLGGLGRFEAVVTRDEVTTGKPDPSGYALACRLLGAAPGDTVAIEDAPSGVRAARDAGVARVLGVTTTWPGRELVEAGAAPTVPDLTAVPGFLAADPG